MSWNSCCGTATTVNWLPTVATTPADHSRRNAGTESGEVSMASAPSPVRLAGGAPGPGSGPGSLVIAGHPGTRRRPPGGSGNRPVARTSVRVGADAR